MRKHNQIAYVTTLVLASWVTQTQAKSPNILFILTDDQAPHTLKAYGNSVCQTPNLDRLSREGITLTAAHHMGAWSGAVCWSAPRIEPGSETPRWGRTP